MSRVNAMCLGGPLHGALTWIDQEVGTVDIDDPTGSGRCPQRYQITRERAWHPSSDTPFIVLIWIGTTHP